MTLPRMAMRGEVKRGDQEEHDPGPIAEEVCEILGEGGFLLRVGLDALLRRGEGDDEEENAEDGEQAHGDLVAARVVAAAEEDDHRDGEALHDKARRSWRRSGGRRRCWCARRDRR